MLIRKLFKNRGMAINIMAGLSFLVLAVYGWDLSGKELLNYLLVLLACLAVLIGLAVLTGFLLRKLNEMHDRDD